MNIAHCDTSPHAACCIVGCMQVTTLVSCGSFFGLGLCGAASRAVLAAETRHLAYLLFSSLIPYKRICNLLASGIS